MEDRDPPDGGLDADGQRMVVVTMPHEQVHHFQKRLGAVTPRWFHEGHAEWVGRKVAATIAPADAAASARDYAAALTALKGSVALAAWGGVQAKREAIMRQVPPEEQRKMAADPNHYPAGGGPYSFGPGDIVSDERNTQARYEAAWRVFRDLEAAHGAAAVQAWVTGLTATSGRITRDAIAEAARAAFHDDLSSAIK